MKKVEFPLTVVINPDIIFMNNNKRNLLLKLSVIRKVLEQRGVNNQRSMAWRATGSNNEEFIDQIRGKYLIILKITLLILLIYFRKWNFKNRSNR